MTTTSKPKRNVTQADIKALRTLLSNTQAKVLTPSDEGYATSIERWSRAAEKPAGVSIIPTTASEVGIALKYANDHSIDVAVKGGGHSTAGASSTNGGLLIDLRSMFREEPFGAMLMLLRGSMGWPLWAALWLILELVG
jgi:hypothetical protein